MAAGGSTIGALRVVLGIDSAALTKGLKDAQSNLNRFGKGVSGVTSEIFNLRNAMIGLAGGAFISLVKRSAQFGDNIGEVAEMAGVSAKALQELRYVFVQSGLSSEEADKSIMALTRRLGEAKFKSNEASDALARLGISMADIQGKAPNEVIGMIADRLPGVTDEMKKAAIVADLFGARIGQKLIPSLMLGSKELKRLAVEAAKMGLILSDEDIAKADLLTKEFQKLGLAWQVAATKGAGELLPVFRELRVVFTSKEFQQGVKDTAKNLGDLIRYLVNNKDTILQLTGALAGFKLGRAFGPIGAAVGAVGGAAIVGAQQLKGAAGELKQAEADYRVAVKGMTELQGMVKREQDTARDPTVMSYYAREMMKLSIRADEAQTKITALKAAAETVPEEPTRVYVSKVAPAGLISPEVRKAIEDAHFKMQVLRGDFNGLAADFPETARGLGLFGTELHKAVTNASELSPELQALNNKMMELQAAKVVEGLKTELQKYNEEVAKLNMLHAAGKLPTDQFYAAVNKANYELSRTSQLTGIFESALSSALDRAIEGTTTLNEQMRQLGYELAKATASAAFKALLFGTPQTGSGLIGGLIGAAGGRIGFQHGGSFRVGGSGPADSQLVAFRATPGERVDVRTPGQQRDMGQAPVNVNAPVRVVNAFDAVDFLSKALGEAGGERVILNYVRANPSAFRAALS